jgi:TrmH family RNA methyltransferase
MNIQKIESRDNPRLKLARKIRDGKDHEFVFVEGTRLAEEAVWSDLRIEFCLLDDRYLGDDRRTSLIESIQQKTVDVFELNEQAFSSVSDTTSSQGIILIGRRPKANRESFELAVGKRTSTVPLVLMLNEINNPSNLGAVIRTAEAAGAIGVVISENSADVYSPKALRGSMGSVFRMPIWAHASTADVITWANSNGFSTVGASAAAERSYTDVDWATPHLLVMGSEAHGIPLSMEEGLDQRIRIPMDERIESLNLAVATGIILFEARRQVSRFSKN